MFSFFERGVNYLLRSCFSPFRRFFIFLLYFLNKIKVHLSSSISPSRLYSRLRRPLNSSTHMWAIKRKIYVLMQFRKTAIFQICILSRIKPWNFKECTRKYFLLDFCKQRVLEIFWSKIYILLSDSFLYVNEFEDF